MTRPPSAFVPRRRPAAAVARTRAIVTFVAAHNRISKKESPMQDLLWIAALGGLVAATLAYVGLCDKA